MGFPVAFCFLVQVVEALLPTSVGLNRACSIACSGSWLVSPTDMGLNRNAPALDPSTGSVSPTSVGLNRFDGQALIAYWKMRNEH